MELRKKSTQLDQLLQIAKTPIWDGDLISKSNTKKLYLKGLINQGRGFSFISLKGITLLDSIGMIKR